jgi:hypothetical protein
MAMAPNSRDMRGMSDDELIALADSIGIRTQVGLNFIVEESGRRVVERQTTTVARLTRVLVVLTAVILAFTILLAVTGD